MSNIINTAHKTLNESSFKISIEEESCLKSALAFVVLRQRLKNTIKAAPSKREKQKINDANQNNNQQKRVHVLENILSPISSSSDQLILPSKEDHILSMLEVCLGTIHSSFYQHQAINKTSPPLYSYYTDLLKNNAVLDGIISHLSMQLYQYQPKKQKDSNNLNQLLRKIFKKNNTNKKDIACICIFFYQLVLYEEERNRGYNNNDECLSLSVCVIQTICNEIFDLYHDTKK